MIQELPMAFVRPDPAQPRKTFNEKSIAELGESIRAQGLIQPVTVRQGDAPYYYIIAGERRYRAHLYINALTIKAIVDNTDRTSASKMAMQLIENLQREEMNPMDTARGLQALVEGEWEIAQIANTLGYAPETIERKLSLNSLEPKIQTHVASGQIPESIALLLTKLSSDGQYLALRKIRGKPYSQAKPIVDAILEAEHQVDLFAPTAPTRQQKSMVRRYTMMMLALTAFVKAITSDEYRILANGLDDGRMGKRIMEIELAMKGLRKIKGELEKYQQHKKLRKAA